jgi:alkenylglycerophosphocholine hydrolase
VVLVVTPLAVRFVRALRAAQRDALVVPVVAYMSAISAMLVSAIASGNAFAIVGGLAFVASDSLIAETRFVQPRTWGPVAIMATYHVALLGLVLSLL